MSFPALGVHLGKTVKSVFGPIVTAVCFAILLTGCSKKETPTEVEPEINNNVDRANPAAVYCVDQGGEYILQTGRCNLPNGESVSAWEFFRHREQK
ncbi:DUF333 domain-containing protein [Aestuariicella sp. G3-2]|uniref:putative hemolysin n=1 Tax=Pseudomaricurvus albidus TaxID=2842452 RepID=UPI001C0BADA4|nr:DUF333 domain-containing protein [Aestuariicella albida]MBU3068640.1 DUF333 domain-containing protein [Aestuariicella albida]